MVTSQARVMFVDDDNIFLPGGGAMTHTQPAHVFTKDLTTNTDPAGAPHHPSPPLTLPLTHTHTHSPNSEGLKSCSTETLIIRQEQYEVRKGQRPTDGGLTEGTWTRSERQSWCQRKTHLKPRL